MLKSIIVLPDGTEISSGVGTTNAILSVQTTEAVNVGEELMIGSIFSNMLEATILTPGGNLNIAAGDEVTLYKVDDAGARTKIGIYIMEKPTRPTANKIKIIGYDRVIKLDRDMSAWLKELSEWPYALKDFAHMVCDACGVTLLDSNFPNMDFPVIRFYKTGVTGRQILRWVCEMAARFCRANADGELEIAWYQPSGKTITPSGEYRYFANSLTYDTFLVESIDVVQLRLADGGDGALWPAYLEGTVIYEYVNIRGGPGTDTPILGQLYQGDRVRVVRTVTLDDGTVWGRIDRGWVCITGHMEVKNAEAKNPYIISGNNILMTSINDDLLPTLAVIENELKDFTYTPCKVEIPATLDIRAGQIIDITDINGVTIHTLVMEKITNGQRDTIRCTGSQIRSSASATNNRSAGELIADAINQQTHEEIFNKLTKNGAIQGIYVQDGKWYINAELAKIVNIIADSITSGILASKDGNCYFNLDTGSIKAKNSYGSFVEIIGGSIEFSRKEIRKLAVQPYEKFGKDENGDPYVEEYGILIDLYDGNGKLYFGIEAQNEKPVLYLPSRMSDGSLGIIRGFCPTWKYSEALGGFYIGTLEE